MSSGGCVALQMAFACLSTTLARVESTMSAHISSCLPRLPRNLYSTFSVPSTCSNGRTHVGKEASPWQYAAKDARRRIHARMISNGLGFSSFFLLGCRPINRSLFCSYSIDCAEPPVLGWQTSCSTHCSGADGPLWQALGCDVKAALTVPDGLSFAVCRGSSFKVPRL